ncbi:hypothetical protein [Stenotrophomonas rhizophila]|uniref:hypothetical protein n=1 Tax=Stenotrophomonas rhizophila TaxID=216778 RepID=UPI00112F211B|nr:hypothetical protein [Stenotrophomonas rhizophila]
MKDFNEVLGSRILASDICEPLKSCSAVAPADQIRAELERLDFTIAGVRELEASPVIGYVESAALVYGEVRDHLHGLTEVAVIPKATDVVALLTTLQDKPFLYVEGESGIEAILTWVDINKPMVRIYIFGLISLLEMHLSFWVANVYGDDEWIGFLTKERVEAAMHVQGARRGIGQELTLIQCLQLCDKRKLVLRSDALVELFGLGSKRAGKRFFKSVEALRDALAHSQYDLVVRNEWAELLSLIGQVQKTVELSDDRVESDALDSSTRFAGLLW